MMKWILILGAAIAWNLMAADISGTWKGTAETQFGKAERTFTFKVDGSKVTGETTSDMFGKSAIEDGKIDGDDLSFTITVSFQGNEAKASYKGKVSGDTIKFTVQVEGVDQTVEYTAKRVS